MKQDNFDIVIIGTGMGGLICGDILSREGYRVCMLEKNKQIGGCLQIYVREKVIFDSGVHYIGGLDKGQSLHQVFQYLGIMEKLKVKKMGLVFDKIIIGNDEKEYAYAQGYENFIKHLLVDFPGEEQALQLYCDRIKYVCSKFPLYNLRVGGRYSEKEEVLNIDTKSYIESITSNTKLQAVLAGNNMLYAGQPGKTPFYVHAMILNSYIESSWKCLNGGAQIAKYMARNILDRGGMIRRNATVKEIVVENDKVSYVLLTDDSKVFAKNFISNIHPLKTLEMTKTNLIKNVFRNRVKSLENSISVFTINVIFNKDSFKYRSTNYYYFDEGRVWTSANYTETNWPLSYVLFFSGNTHQQEYAESMTILTYMRFDEVKQWEATFNTIAEQDDRGDTYANFKKNKAEILLNKVSEKFPDLKTHIKSYYTSTPLTYRDYIGNDDGSMYGIVKDYKDPLRTYIPSSTKLTNLYFTGQNLNLHGILGATMSGLLTCIDFMGNDTIIEKIKNA
ncbi:MAG: NAD(P)/FAD-dependent oxidoreductase [Ferruginibacter sp.]